MTTSEDNDLLEDLFLGTKRSSRDTICCVNASTAQLTSFMFYMGGVPSLRFLNIKTDRSGRLFKETKQGATVFLLFFALHFSRKKLKGDKKWNVPNIKKYQWIKNGHNVVYNKVSQGKI